MDTVIVIAATAQDVQLYLVFAFYRRSMHKNNSPLSCNGKAIRNQNAMALQIYILPEGSVILPGEDKRKVQMRVEPTVQR